MLAAFNSLERSLHPLAFLHIEIYEGALWASSSFRPIALEPVRGGRESWLALFRGLLGYRNVHDVSIIQEGQEPLDALVRSNTTKKGKSLWTRRNARICR
jgi:hypothetical protein